MEDIEDIGGRRKSKKGVRNEERKWGGCFASSFVFHFKFFFYIFFLLFLITKNI